MGTKLAIAMLAALTAGACAATPGYTRTATTLDKVDMTGLECRREAPIDSNLGQTICASPQQWALYEKKARVQTERFFDEEVDSVSHNPFRRSN